MTTQTSLPSAEALAMIIRNEVVRQYREDECRKCHLGSAHYEEHISPYLIALRVLHEISVRRGDFGGSADGR